MLVRAHGIAGYGAWRRGGLTPALAPAVMSVAFMAFAFTFRITRLF
jgi:hypothetical protein